MSPSEPSPCTGRKGARGLYLLFFLFREPLTASVRGRSIIYHSPHFYLGAVLVLYLLATCVSGLF